MPLPVFSVPPPDRAAESETRARFDALAKPPGSLGALESLAARLAGAQGRVPPTVERPRVLVFAGDHGVARAHSVSPYPPEVTAAMVRTFAAGRAAVSVLARAAGAGLEVVDVGVIGLGVVSSVDGVTVHRAPVRPGTRDLVAGPALDEGELSAALQVGVDAADRAAADGVDLLAVGEMGIGNTTAAAAVAARLLGRPAEALVGPGTGLDSAGVARKAAVVARALDRGGPTEPLLVLGDLGGLELAALAGCLLRAAERRIPVLVDGFIASAAALAALQHEPGLQPYLIPATRSTEPGHGAVLAALALGEPVLNLGLRLGEASGAALAIPILASASRLVREMATLAEVLAGGGP